MEGRAHSLVGVSQLSVAQGDGAPDGEVTDPLAMLDVADASPPAATGAESGAPVRTRAALASSPGRTPEPVDAKVVREITKKTELPLS